MRKTIGNNPLDAVVPDLRSLQNHSDSEANSGKTSEQQEAILAARSDSRRKERLTIHLPVELIERVKNAVFWTPGLTLAELGERALEEFVTDLEKEHGGAFESRSSELKGGRPLKR